jgi:hypothetical protein
LTLKDLQEAIEEILASNPDIAEWPVIIIGGDEISSIIPAGEVVCVND